MAGLITSLLEMGLEERLLDILVKTFKVILIHMDIRYPHDHMIGLVSIWRTHITRRFVLFFSMLMTILTEVFYVFFFSLSKLTLGKHIRVGHSSFL
jgi:hypothetical protein